MISHKNQNLFKPYFKSTKLKSQLMYFFNKPLKTAITMNVLLQLAHMEDNIIQYNM